MGVRNCLLWGLEGSQDSPSNNQGSQARSSLDLNRSTIDDNRGGGGVDDRGGGGGGLGCGGGGEGTGGRRGSFAAFGLLLARGRVFTG